ncbi:DoxX family protein [Croceibacterium sp. TMG7-5b_MA50]|uniref:DoxX family protein n=1 Tax=Croceibacterium sp. TMG7-5b_MA50 TaxID=3121290 RepID=UPI0032217382
MIARRITGAALALFYGTAGVFHLARPAPFLSIMPRWVPAPELVVQATGWAELAGAAALAQPWSAGLRRAGGWGLAAYALCVWPANVQHMLLDFARADGGLGPAYHSPRMLAQPVLIWAGLWTGGVTDWPWRRR